MELPEYRLRLVAWTWAGTFRTSDKTIGVAYVDGSRHVIGVTEFPDNDLFPLLASSVGLLVLLLYFPGGLAQIGYSSRRALLAWVASLILLRGDQPA